MKISNIIKSSLSLLSTLSFLMVFFPTSANALTVSPARIEISGNPGDEITKTITLFNDSKTSSQTYFSSYSNFEAQGETGSPRFVDPVNDLGTWMSTGVDSFTLAPGTSRDVVLSIKIPKDAYAGGHFAAVFFGNNPNNGGQVSVGAKIGSLVLLSVNGNVLEAGGVAGFKTKNNQKFYNSLPVSFEYRFKNDGNDRVKPAGNITIHNAIYYPTDHINANAVSGNILPHSTRLFNVDWVKSPRSSDYVVSSSLVGRFFDQVSYQWDNFAVGPYIAHLDIIYGTANIRTTDNVFFFVFPWQLLLCVFLLFGMVFFFGSKLLKKYNNYIIKKARVGISSKHDVKNE
jgi:hypothetical protein